MRYIKNIAILLVSLFCFWACETELDTVRLNPESGFKAPTLVPMADVIVNADNSKVEAVIFNWSEADFGVPTQIEYALYLTGNGKEALAGTSFGTSLTLTKADLNGLVVNDLSVPANETAAIGAYLATSVYGTAVKGAKSNTVTFNVTTFKASLRYRFICGEFQGWTIGEAPIIWETDGGTNIYRTLVDLENGTDDLYSYFKITEARDWSHANWGYDYLTPSWECPEQNDHNLSVPKAEGIINLLTINVGKMTIDREPHKSVGLIGAFDESGWNTEIPFVYDAVSGTWEAGPVTFSGETNFLIRLSESWDHKYGDGVKASDSVPGGFEVNKGGADINVPSTGTYVMRLYADRTPFVLVMEKQ